MKKGLHFVSKILLLLCASSGSLSGFAQQQGISISGKVTSEEGENLPGVNILIKGTTLGTVSDSDGAYKLTVPGKDVILVYTFVGYLSEEIQVGDRTEIDIALFPDITKLSEIVVVGYGAQERAEVTGAIASVKGDAIENLPASSLDNLIQGRAAGVQISQTSGAPGGAISVRIRGNNSIGGGNEPLYIVDGVPIKSGNFAGLTVGSAGLNALSDINPNDIASIEILKDASSASIYGARASNGVVLITTKRGLKGEPKIDFNFYTGIQQLSNKLPLSNGRQHRDRFTEGWFTNGGRRLRDNLTDTLNPTLNHVNVDWQDEIFRTANISNYDVSLRGGSENITYSVNAGYFDQEGILLNSDFRRFSNRVNVEYKASRKLTVGSNLSYSRSLSNSANVGTNGIGAGNTGVRNASAIQMWMNQFAFMSPRDSSGINWEGRNPVRILEDVTNMGTSNRLIGNLYWEFEIIEGLKFRSNIALDLLSLKEERFMPSTIDFSPFREASERNFQDIGWINENILTYTKTLKDFHNLTALVGFSQQENSTDISLLRVSGAPSNKITTLNAGVNLEEATSSQTIWGIFSLFGRINYNYKDRYLVTATFRRDGSSRFGDDNEWANFPSVSIGWRISEEPFFDGFSFFDDLKIRASWGKTGNQDLGGGVSNFISQGIYASGQNYLGEGGIAPASNGLPNPTLSWETTNQIDVGIDFSVLEGKLNFIADYYSKKTKDLLFNAQVPGTTGFQSFTTNLGEIENKGFEFSVDAKILDGPLKWNLNANIAFNDNKVLKLPGGEDQFVTISNQIRAIGVLREGEPLGSFYGWIVDGVYSTQEEVPVIDGQTLSTNGVPFQAGDAIFRDLNGDNIINDEDRTIIGSAQPDFTGGFGSAFTFKGIELNAFFNFSVGNDIYNAPSRFRNGMEEFSPNPDPDRYNRAWRNPGDVTDVPIVWFNNPRNNDRNSTMWLEDGSFLRLKTITLAYSLPPTLTEKVKLANVRVYVTGQNLLTFTEYEGYDPEVVSSSSFSSGLFGVDDYRFPLSRSVIFGINVGF